MGKRNSEVGPVNVVYFFFGEVHVLAPWTENSHGTHSHFICHSYRHDVLSVANDFGTNPESALQILGLYDLESVGGNDESLVDEAVQFGCFLENGLELLVSEVVLVGDKVGDDDL